MGFDEQDCRRLTENVGKGYFFYRHDASGVLTYVSPSIQDMLGYSPADHPPHFKARMTSDPGNASAARRTEMGLQGERQPPYEVEVLHKDGSARWLEVTEFPLRDRSGRVTGLEGIAKDVTDRKEMEEASSRSQKLSEGIINAITDEVWFADADKKFRLMNEAAIRNFATDKPVGVEELTRSLEVFRSDGSPRPVEEAPPLRALEGQTVINQEEIMRLPYSGELRHRQVSAAPVRDAQGAIIGSVSVVKDVTSQKQAESALVNMQKLESLGILAGGIAHDFNNLLTAILGNLSLLQAKLDGGEETLVLLKEAQDACGAAKSLSNELLTFSKGGAPIVQAADLRPVLAQAAVFSARGTKTRCVFNLGEAPLMVSIDKDLISRVVQNLVLNATQAMPQGGDFTVKAEIVDLGATAKPPRAAGRYVRVTAEDEGMGIKPEALPKIFDPYFSTKGVGRGLGLSICYSIMLKHGGNISAAPRPGAGAVFTLHFPCAAAAGAADAPADREKPALKIGGGRILIMDDEVSLARVLKRIIEHLGGEADAVTNGKDALDAYRRAMEAGRPFDAVIMDLTVAGGMGGMEMVGALLELDPSAKAIVSSGYADDPVMTEFARRGFSDKLVKPYDIAQASTALRRVLGRS